MRWIFAFTLLTSCGGFTEGFNKGFDKSFRESCLNGALKKGADKAVAEKYCECALAKFKETKSMDKAAEACVPK